MIFFDIETFPITPECIAPRPVCIQIKSGSQEAIIGAWEPWLPEFLMEVIASKEEICGQNIPYDFLCLSRWFPVLKPIIWEAYNKHRIEDTLIRQKLIDIAEGVTRKSYSLAVLGTLAGVKKDSNDPWRLRYGELYGVPVEDWPNEAREYAINDVRVTETVFEWQKHRYESPDRFRQARAAFWLHHIQDYGIFTDEKYLPLLQDQERKAFELDKKTLQADGLVRQDGTKDTKKAKALITSLGSTRKTKKGGVSLDAKACATSGSPVLEAYARYTSRGTILKRIEGLKPGFCGTIRPIFDSLKATGRTSSIQGRPVSEGGIQHSAQMQNMPRSLGLREAFIPAEGECIIGADYSTVELCTWAQVCLWALGFSDMATALNEGKDPHLMLGGELLGESYQWMVERRMEPVVKDARHAAKAGNLGFPGGLGIPAFLIYAADIWGIRMNLSRGAEIKEVWFSRWSEAQPYLDWIRRHREVMGRRVIKQFQSDRIRGGCSYTEACNSYFQGLAADAAKFAGYNLVREIENGDLREWKLWNFVHDEFLFRGPVEDCDRAAKVIKKVMEESAHAVIPDVPPKAEPVAMDRWSKNAKAIYDKEGKLIPCQIPLNMS